MASNEQIEFLVLVLLKRQHVVCCKLNGYSVTFPVQIGQYVMLCGDNDMQGGGPRQHYRDSGYVVLVAAVQPGCIPAAMDCLRKSRASEFFRAFERCGVTRVEVLPGVQPTYLHFLLPPLGGGMCVIDHRAEQGNSAPGLSFTPFVDQAAHEKKELAVLESLRTELAALGKATNAVDFVDVICATHCNFAYVLVRSDGRVPFKPIKDFMASQHRLMGTVVFTPSSERRVRHNLPRLDPYVRSWSSGHRSGWEKALMLYHTMRQRGLPLTSDRRKALMGCLEQYDTPGAAIAMTAAVASALATLRTENIACVSPPPTSTSDAGITTHDWVDGLRVFQAAIQESRGIELSPVDADAFGALTQQRHVHPTRIHLSTSAEATAATFASPTGRLRGPTSTVTHQSCTELMMKLTAAGRWRTSTKLFGAVVRSRIVPVTADMQQCVIAALRHGGRRQKQMAGLMLRASNSGVQQ